jgi:hypothetical protein
MTRTRWLIVLFWVFVFVMLIKSFIDYNRRAETEAELHPQPTQGFFTTLPPPPPPPVPSAAADVRQTSFEVQTDTPSPGNFTCLVTVKNFGLSRAENIQVRVRPYRGTRRAPIQQNYVPSTPLSEDDPLSQLSSWLAFPDLAPGESSTQSVVFTSMPPLEPGLNPNPEIHFDSAKPGP